MATAKDSQEETLLSSSVVVACSVKQVCNKSTFTHPGALLLISSKATVWRIPVCIPCSSTQCSLVSTYHIVSPV